ncbi:hypothetical protein RF11_04378 [Thelohanellus kitauei]|uniref:Tc1-like transposase DDE domain-containing protein n=1 Tax=Thelohanellus kitauei TaxID=669202 RepID=A0A0C2MF38_THEKT|nr:hypothetical protein RF11_04378 [Thelohanellus kitauei]
MRNAVKMFKWSVLQPVSPVCQIKRKTVVILSFNPKLYQLIVLRARTCLGAIVSFDEYKLFNKKMQVFNEKDTQKYWEFEEAVAKRYWSHIKCYSYHNSTKIVISGCNISLRNQQNQSPIRNISIEHIFKINNNKEFKSVKKEELDLKHEAEKIGDTSFTVYLHCLHLQFQSSSQRCKTPSLIIDTTGPIPTTTDSTTPVQTTTKSTTPEPTTTELTTNEILLNLRANILPKRITGQRIVFIPPYSPQLSQIELLFSKWKNIIESGMSIYDGNTLLTPISAASTQISGDDCAGWIREATRFASRALQREPL